ncbi:MAG TPA: cupredoxin family copper-binding protein [Terriglobales bacterium]|jgi:plastocyanin|nr:cupredoxin family copper-binding protein [Terriglobales bacterium]
MTKTNLFLSAVALVLAVGLASVLVLHPTMAKGETAASPLEVRVDNFTFGPATLTVPVNSMVTWLNKDDLPHVIASNDGVFKSKALDTDDKFSYTFSKAGTYGYFCSIHPKMVGTIVVK